MVSLLSRALSSAMNRVTCHPQRIFTNCEYAVVLLNQQIAVENNLFIKIWNNATIRHLVDGGANQYFAVLDRQPENVKVTMKCPDIASGDFDSITESSMSRLKDKTGKPCKIVETPDQDETDFSKGLRLLYDELKRDENSKVKSVVIICEFTGRLDQILGNLNTLHKNVFAEDTSPDKPSVYLMSTDTLAWLLPAQRDTVMTFENDVPDFTCGVIPLQGKTTFTTKGLQWDMTPDMVCQFGGLVSTSNKVISKMLHITPHDKHAVFCVEMKSKDYVV